MIQKSKKRLFWADLIRTLAILFVVLVHIVLLPDEWRTIPFDWWLSGIAYNSLGHIAVPLFVILSGALLLGKEENYINFFTKRVMKVVIPWVGWTIIYIFWNLHFLNPHLNDFKEWYHFIFSIFFGQFWFIPMIVGLYLITPILRIVTNHWRKKDIVYVILLWIIIFSLLPFFQKIIHVNLTLSESIIMQYGGYYLLGFILRDIQIKKEKLFYTQLLFITGFLATILGIYLSSKNQDTVDYYYLTYLTPNMILFSVSAFLLLKEGGNYLEKKASEKFKNAIILFSKASFGIFLLHPIVAATLKNGYLGLTFNSLMFHPILAIPCVLLLVWGISFFIVSLLKKIPYIKMIVP